jgi:Post-segregation antitoxin CcdA
MSRRKFTLRLNSDVVKRAKNAGMNLSYFLEVKLVEYLALLNVTPRRRFELLLPPRRTGFQGRRVRPDFATSAYGYN